MTGKAVLQHSDPKYFNEHEDHSNTTVTESYSPTEVATTVTFTVALFQVSIVFKSLKYRVLLLFPLDYIWK